MATLRVAWLLLLAVPAWGGMECGDGVSLCGVLTLESGYGSGNYEHPEPVVHGLWPETDSYGDSKCKEPGDMSDPDIIYPCYQQRGEDDADLLSFEIHEWEKHGWCAGVEDAEGFFTQVCSMSDAPLLVMNTTRQNGGDLDAMSDALTAAGYSIYSTDSENSQVELSACAKPGGKWVLAAVEDFSALCGGWDDDDDDDGSDTVDSCEPNTHGPPCSEDSDCTSYMDCLRCAGSGYCTDVPL
uniref:Uncharacterized protein n=1 Tax=Rhizochromulina marina TaxID=1034831 RepID=A0A7S2WAR2_9STRA|mmetsp:Transcript_19657/g.57383  ORF Transcript_19657/g.57383 Transcript_19657/m.57383 type:complete len:241 (+) Transcript_19657:124-846(+)